MTLQEFSRVPQEMPEVPQPANNAMISVVQLGAILRIADAMEELVKLVKEASK